MAGDANYTSVSLLLHCDGSNGSTTFTDNSQTPKTVTANGNAQISTAQSKWGGSSALFDGTDDYLTVGNAADWKHLHDDTTDYAIEGWVYWSGGSSDLTIVSTAAATANIGFLLQVMGSDSRKLNVQIYRGSGGNGLSATSSSGITAGAWTYFKFSYTKTTRAYAFRIGSAAAGSGTMTVTGSWSASSTSDPSFTLAVGRYQNASPGGYLNGYLDDLRITQAARTETAEPTEAFPDRAPQVSGNVKDAAGANAARTVRAYRRDTGVLVGQAYTQAGDSNIGSVSLLLHADGTNGSTTFTDSSPSPKTITAAGDAQISTAQSKFGGASMLFDGTGDFLTTPATTDLLFGSGDFTAEAWVRPSSVSIAQKIVGVWSDTTGVGFSWKLGILNTGYLYFSYSTTGGNGFAVSATSQQLSANVWHHVACARSGTTIYLFVDGVQAGSATGVSVTFFATSSSKLLEIGRDGAGTTEYFNGYIDDIRITKGVARYTANFTPPSDRHPDNDLTLGSYAFTLPTLDELNIVAYDDADGTLYNDQIIRVIPA